MTDILETIDDKPNQNSMSVLKALEIVAPILPTPVYWHDVNGVVLGVNEHCLKGMGTIREEVIGRTPYEFYPKDVAEHILKHNEHVIKTGQILSQEEVINNITTGKLVYALAIKSPLYNDEGKVIGILGTSIDITAEKEAEELKKQANRIVAKEQEKFREIVGQVNHDIRSPLTSLQILTSKFAYLFPEDERNTFNTAITRIIDIANNMMNYFKPKVEVENEILSEENSPLLVSIELLEILAEKKYEYIKNSIEFRHNFSQRGNFIFVNIDPRAFGRMISNIINNAVDSLEDDEGIVEVKLNVEDEIVEIVIEDNGKGMLEVIKNKIMNNEAISAGKKDGHGIGLTQVRQVLERSGGELDIESKIGEGTKIILTFPKAATPNWIAESIIINNNLIVIVDDDPSIHGAWDSRFKTNASTIAIKHFEVGEEAISYINNLPEIEKQKVLLLTDYELLKQNINGLDVIKQSNIKNCILVTSHYANTKVRELAAKSNVKILPKALAFDIPVIFKNG
ncbi:MAG TPA: PAS domain-containing sensor histidine kinase [Burkholderiales bacterium]|nr:PAS domain-containing sensor histidine kinase [Burkholderiales bacterium]